MKSKTKEFKVRGNARLWAFPVDMLRYDACYPSSPEDANKIANSLDRETRRELYNQGDFVVISLRCDNTPMLPTHGRWESFGWKVVE